MQFHIPHPLKYGAPENFNFWGERSAQVVFNDASSIIRTILLPQAKRKRKKERTVDALALGGDEGRGKLR